MALSAIELILILKYFAFLTTSSFRFIVVQFFVTIFEILRGDFDNFL